MNKLIFYLFCLFYINSLSHAWAGSVVYKGEMGQGIGFHLNISQFENKLNGEINYLRGKGSIETKGECTDNGFFILREFNKHNSNTGIFQGKMCQGFIVGQWRKPNYSFSYFFLAKSEKDYDEDSLALYTAVYKWNEAHNTKDLTVFSKLYADEVLFYAKTFSKEISLEKKQSTLEKYSSFFQMIPSPVSFTAYQNGKIHATFTKEVLLNGEEMKSYPSYLILEKLSGEFKLTGEGDEITDRNLNFKLDLGEPILADAKFSGSNFIYVALGLLGLVAIAAFIFVKKRRVGSNQNLKNGIKGQSKNSNIQSEAEPKILDSKVNTTHQNTEEINELSISQPEKTKEEKEKMGKEFVDTIISRFNRKYFKLMDVKSDYFRDGRYPEANKYPDILFEYNDFTHKEVQFAVECKFRSNLNGKKVFIDKMEKIENYKNFGAKRGLPVFLVLGVCGNPKNPENIFIIPIQDIHSPEMSEFQLKKYNKAIASSEIRINAANKTLY
jgi:hypothetical protein